MPTFTDSPFLPAAEKRRILTQWHRFLQTLARRFSDHEQCFRAFPDALYHHLIRHCSYIAHYDRAGFFDHYFRSADDAERFLRQFDAGANPHGRSVEYGDDLWLGGTHADINEAMRDTVAPLLPGIHAALERSRNRETLARATALLATYRASLVPR